ncbi:hypothetical protein PQI66_05370 [Corynebacterium sp. USCH3]|uniref:hypothetical protein n=1 Tax=Corynebacterium sp. USCH3 TaxID=3024840 RepID=UPI003099C9FC
MRVAKLPSEANQDPTVRPIGNLVAGTFHAAPEEIGLTIADAADAGTITVINADSVEIVDFCPGLCDAPG